MFFNYLKVAYRNMVRNKFYSGINILGLAIGMACFVFILLFIQDEYSYDTYHPEHERIYRICEKLDAEEGQGENSSSQPFPVAKALCNDYPQYIDKAVRFFNFQEPAHTLQYGIHKVNERRTFFVDSSYFEVFGNTLFEGDPKTALKDANTIVLTKTLAKKYFGSASPIGKRMKYDGNINLMVTGVFNDLPEQTHLHFDALISFSTLKAALGPNIGAKNWVWNPCWTYLKLKQGVHAQELENEFPNFIKKYFPDFIIPQASLYLQAISSIHLGSKLDYEIEPNGDKLDVMVLGAIGIFILIIACINFMNLSTARSAKRAKEVGMRKVFGAHRSQLLKQFLGESLLFSLIAFLFAVVLVEVFLPVFNAFTTKTLVIRLFSDFPLLIIMLCVTLTVGLVAGIYPAFFLSSFEPLHVLKGTFSLGNRSKRFRQSLVILQFAISLALIISTAIIYQQLHFLRSADLGFNKEEVLVVPVRPPMAHIYTPFAEEIRSNRNVKNVASMNEILGSNHNTHEYNYEGMPQNKKWIYFPSLIVSSEFIPAMGIELLAGRGFDKKFCTDDSLSVVINEAMVKHLGWGTPEQAIGKQFFTPTGHERVIGVAKNFNFVSLNEQVGPFVLDMANRHNRLFWTKFIVIRVKPENMRSTLTFIENKWTEFSKEFPFEYFFLNDNLAKLYKAQDDLGSLVAYFSVLAIFIACLGLFALASFTAEQRTKEMGIRKVLGASIVGIVNLMSKEFLRLVLISNIIAWPVTYYVMHNWLGNFAYHIEIRWGVFVLSGIAALCIAMFTVFFHALRSAYNNPALALKYE